MSHGNHYCIPTPTGFVKGQASFKLQTVLSVLADKHQLEQFLGETLGEENIQMLAVLQT